MDLDFPCFLRSVGARMGFFTARDRRRESVSWQHGTIDERGLPGPDSRNPRRRCAAPIARLRRPGVGRHRSAACVEIARPAVVTRTNHRTLSTLKRFACQYQEPGSVPYLELAGKLPSPQL